MKVLYFDCFSGAAGDMILGALLDAGLPLDDLRRALGSLAVSGWEISAERVLRAGVTATKFRVHEQGGAPDVTPALALSAGVHQHHHHHHHHHGAAPDDHHSSDHGHVHTPPDAPGAHAHRSLADIHAAIDRSALSEGGKRRAQALFNRLAEAESAVHGTPMERVHLHEVGALDSIIDVVGTVFALEWFAADRIVVSPINVGSGTVRTAHGLFPVPAPATVRLMQNVPVYSTGVDAELLTPTGALLLSDYASSFGPLPRMRVNRVGYGAGDRDFRETPNTVRVLVGEADAEQSLTRVVVLECEIDDMNPQLFGPLMDRLFEAGALDVFYTPVQMKKARPGTLVTIVAAPEHRTALTTIVFRETTTIGIRHHEMQRECLEREITVVETRLGPVRFKVARRDAAVQSAQPEFDDLTRLSADLGVPVKDVQAAAWKAWLERT